MNLQYKKTTRAAPQRNLYLTSSKNINGKDEIQSMHPEKEDSPYSLYDNNIDYLSIKYNGLNSALGYNALNFLPFKGRDMLPRVVSDRVKFLKSSTDEIKQMLHERQKLKDALNSERDEDICKTQTALYELDSLANADPARRSSLEKQLADLSQEKRRQELSHWQDTVMLKRELRKAEKELRSAILDLWMLRFLS